MEPVVTASESAGNELGLHPVFWKKYSTLHDLSVLRQSGILLLPGGNDRGNARAYGEFLHLYKGQYAEIYVPDVQERIFANQLWADSLRVLPVCAAG